MTIDEMRAAVAAADAAAAAEREALRVAYMAPVTTLLKSSQWKKVLNDLTAIKGTYAEDGSISVQVNALAEIMPRLAQVVGIFADADAATPPAPTPTPETPTE